MKDRSGSAPQRSNAADRAPGDVRHSWTRSPTLRAFQYPAYRRLWAAGLLVSFGNWIERLAVGWLVFDQTGSVFLTALAFAVRHAPSLLVAPFAGAITDRVERRRLLVGAYLSKAGLVGVLAVIVASGVDSVWPILVVVALSGILFTFEMPGAQALITDIVGRKDSMNGISLYSVGVRAVGVLGALISGLIIASAGAMPVFALAAGVYAIGAIVMHFVKARAASRPRIEGSVLQNTVEGFKVMAGLPVVATLLGLAIFVEILAFSYMAVLPSLARDALEVDARGLGLLVTMAGLGSFLGTVLLAALGDYRRKGLLILGAMLIYGVALIGFGSSGLFGLSLVLIAGVGMMAGIFDALQWTLLQANVPDRMRGRAVGAWVFAIGFGWVGQLEVGAVGEAIGVGAALMLNGALVAIAAALWFAFAARLRRA